MARQDEIHDRSEHVELDLARIESGRMELVAEPTKAVDICRDAAKAMKEQIRRMQVVLMKDGLQDRELKPVDLDKPIKLFPEPGTNSVIIATVEANIQPLNRSPWPKTTTGALDAS